ncbi:MAG: zinc ribbon domain-containing protein [Anaerolineae bacterium]|jgi:putative FmdB family regulatory protein
MPLYEYECTSCGVRFERRQHMDDEPVRACPECGGSVHRLIQPVGIIFKGSGFYVTDNRSKSPTSTPGTVKESSDTSSSDSDSSSSDAPSTESSSTD